MLLNTCIHVYDFLKLLKFAVIFWRPSQFLQISTLVTMVKRLQIQQTSTSSGNLGE